VVAKALPRGRTFTPDRTNAAIDQSRDTLAQALGAVPFLTGRLVKGVAVTNADTLVTHNLGRAMAGFIVVNVTLVGSSLPGYSRAATDPARQVYLSTSGAAVFTGDIWFF
jgi:hypothetical protein